MLSQSFTDAEIYSDASSVGLGVVILHEGVHVWAAPLTEEDSTKHINELETRALKEAALTAKKTWREISLLFG